MNIFRKIIAFTICFCLVFEQAGFAQTGAQIDLSAFAPRAAAGPDSFRPCHLRSIGLRGGELTALLDPGNGKDRSGRNPDAASQPLLRYFLTGLALPDTTFWVNLRPDSPENMIDPATAGTDIGRIMLAADLQLKKDTASYTSPNTPTGRKYWRLLRKKAEELYGPSPAVIPTLTRPWIVPGEILLRESGGGVYIYKARLKVKLESDHLRNSPAYDFTDIRQKELNEYASALIRELIIPQLTARVNSARKYADLRQVYYSLILSQWFKKRFRGQAGHYPEMIDSGKIDGLGSSEKWSPDTYFKAYQKSFKDGEYRVNETVPTGLGQAVRTCVSGGLNLAVAIPDGGTLGEVTLYRAVPGKGFDGGMVPVTVSPGQAATAGVAVAPSALPQGAAVPGSSLRGRLNGIFSFIWDAQEYWVPPVIIGSAVAFFFIDPLLLLIAPVLCVQTLVVIATYTAKREYRRLCREDPEFARVMRGNPFATTNGWRSLAWGLDGIFDMPEAFRAPRKAFTNLARAMVDLPQGIVLVGMELLVDYFNGRRTGEDILRSKLDTARFALATSSGIHPAKIMYFAFHEWDFAKEGVEKDFMMYETIFMHTIFSSDLYAPAEDTPENNLFLSSDTGFYGLITRLNLERMDETVEEMKRRNNVLYTHSHIKTDGLDEKPINGADVLNNYLLNRNRIWQERNGVVSAEEDRPLVRLLARWQVTGPPDFPDKPYYTFALLELLDRHYDSYVTAEQLWGDSPYARARAVRRVMPFVPATVVLARLAEAGVVVQNGEEYFLSEAFKRDLRDFLAEDYREITPAEFAAIPEHEGALRVNGKFYRCNASPAVWKDGGVYTSGDLFSRAMQEARKEAGTVGSFYRIVPVAQVMAEAGYDQAEMEKLVAELAGMLSGRRPDKFLAKSHIMLYKVAAAAGLKSRAEDILKDILRIFRKIGDDFERLETSDLLIEELLRLGRQDQVGRVYDSILEVANAREWGFIDDALIRSRAGALAAMGKPEVSRGVMAGIEAHRIDMKAAVLARVARMLVLSGDTERGRQVCAEALTLARQRGDFQAKTGVFVDCAEVYAEMGMYNEAAALCEDVYLLQSDSYVDESFIVRIGKIYARMEKTGQALGLRDGIFNQGPKEELLLSVARELLVKHDIENAVPLVRQLNHSLPTGLALLAKAIYPSGKTIVWAEDAVRAPQWLTTVRRKIGELTVSPRLLAVLARAGVSRAVSAEINSAIESVPAEEKDAYREAIMALAGGLAEAGVEGRLAEDILERMHPPRSSWDPPLAETIAFCAQLRRVSALLRQAGVPISSKEYRERAGGATLRELSYDENRRNRLAEHFIQIIPRLISAELPPGYIGPLLWYIAERHPTFFKDNLAQPQAYSRLAGLATALYRQSGKSPDDAARSFCQLVGIRDGLSAAHNVAAGGENAGLDPGDVQELLGLMQWMFRSDEEKAWITMMSREPDCAAFLRRVAFVNRARGYPFTAHNILTEDRERELFLSVASPVITALIDATRDLPLPDGNPYNSYFIEWASRLKISPEQGAELVRLIAMMKGTGVPPGLIIPVMNWLFRADGLQNARSGQLLRVLPLLNAAAKKQVVFIASQLGNGDSSGAFLERITAAKGDTTVLFRDMLEGVTSADKAAHAQMLHLLKDLFDLRGTFEPDTEMLRLFLRIFTGAAHDEERDRLLADIIADWLVSDKVTAVPELEAAGEEVKAGRMDPDNRLHLLANYYALRSGDSRAYVSREFSFKDYAVMMDKARNGEVFEGGGLVTAKEERNVRGLVYEAAVMLEKVIMPLARQAARDGKKLVVVGNLSYGGVALAPITEEREGRTYIIGTDIEVWYTKVGSTESHNNELVFVEKLFTDSQLRLLAEENPYVVVVDASTSVSDPQRTSPHIPDGFKGYRNFFMALDQGVFSALHPEDFYEDQDFAQELLAAPGVKEMIARLQAMNVRPRAPDPYKFLFWYQREASASKEGELYLRVNKKIAIAAPKADISAINSPVCVFVQAAIHPEDVDPKVSEGFIQGEYTPGNFDDTDHFRRFYMNYEEGYGLVASRQFVNLARRLFRKYRTWEGQAALPPSVTAGAARPVDAVVLDLDGTIAKTDKTPSPVMTRLLNGLLRAGKDVIIITEDIEANVDARLDKIDKCPGLVIFSDSGANGYSYTASGKKLYFDDYNDKSRLPEGLRDKIIAGARSVRPDVAWEQEMRPLRASPDYRIEFRNVSDRAAFITALNALLAREGVAGAEVYLVGRTSVKIVLQHKEQALRYLLGRRARDAGRALIIGDSARSHQPDRRMLTAFPEAISVNVGSYSPTITRFNPNIIQCDKAGIPATEQFLSQLLRSRAIPAALLAGNGRISLPGDPGRSAEKADGGKESDADRKVGFMIDQLGNGKEPLLWPLFSAVLLIEGDELSPSMRRKAAGVLVNGLGNDDPEVRLAAASALGRKRLKTPQAVIALRGLLRDGDLRVRTAAVSALGDLRAESAVNDLSGLLNDYLRPGTVVDAPYSNLCTATLKSLGMIGGKAARDALFAFFEADAWMRWEAGEALRKVDDGPTVKGLIRFLAVPAGEHELNSKREIAAHVLGKLGDSSAVDGLLQALQDKNGVVRYKVIVALSSLGDSRAIDPIVNSLSDSSDSVRYLAAKTLTTMAEGIRDEYPEWNKVLKTLGALAIVLHESWKLGDSSVESEAENGQYIATMQKLYKGYREQSLSQDRTLKELNTLMAKITGKGLKRILASIDMPQERIEAFLNNDPASMNYLLNLTEVYFGIRKGFPAVCAKIKDALEEMIARDDAAAFHGWLYREAAWNKAVYEKLVSSGYSPLLWRQGFHKSYTVQNAGITDVQENVAKQTEQLLEMAQAAGIAYDPSITRLASYREAADFAATYLLNDTVSRFTAEDISDILAETKRLEETYLSKNGKAQRVTVEVRFDFLRNSFAGKGIPGCFAPRTGSHQEMPLIHGLESSAVFLRVHNGQDKMIANAVLLLTDKGLVVHPLYNASNLNLEPLVFDSLAELLRKRWVPALLMYDNSAGIGTAERYAEKTSIEAVKENLIGDGYYVDRGTAWPKQTDFRPDYALTADRLAASAYLSLPEAAEQNGGSSASVAGKEYKKGLISRFYRLCREHGLLSVDVTPLVRDIERIEQGRTDPEAVIARLSGRGKAAGRNITDDEKAGVRAVIAELRGSPGGLLNEERGRAGNRDGGSYGRAVENVLRKFMADRDPESGTGRARVFSFVLTPDFCALSDEDRKERFQETFYDFAEHLPVGINRRELEIVQGLETLSYEMGVNAFDAIMSLPRDERAGRRIDVYFEAVGGEPGGPFLRITTEDDGTGGMAASTADKLAYITSGNSAQSPFLGWTGVWTVLSRKIVDGINARWPEARPARAEEHFAMVPGQKSVAAIELPLASLIMTGIKYEAREPAGKADGGIATVEGRLVAQAEALLAERPDIIAGTVKKLYGRELPQNTHHNVEYLAAGSYKKVYKVSVSVGEPAPLEFALKIMDAAGRAELMRGYDERDSDGRRFFIAPVNSAYAANPGIREMVHDSEVTTEELLVPIRPGELRGQELSAAVAGLVKAYFLSAGLSQWQDKQTEALFPVDIAFKNAGFTSSAPPVIKVLDMDLARRYTPLKILEACSLALERVENKEAGAAVVRGVKEALDGPSAAAFFAAAAKELRILLDQDAVEFREGDLGIRRQGSGYYAFTEYSHLDYGIYDELAGRARLPARGGKREPLKALLDDFIRSHDARANIYIPLSEVFKRRSSALANTIPVDLSLAYKRQIFASRSDLAAEFPGLTRMELLGAIVEELLYNSWDAISGTRGNITLSFALDAEDGRDVFRITVTDNGLGDRAPTTADKRRSGHALGGEGKGLKWTAAILSETGVAVPFVLDTTGPTKAVITVPLDVLTYKDYDRLLAASSGDTRADGGRVREIIRRNIASLAVGNAGPSGVVIDAKKAWRIFLARDKGKVGASAREFARQLSLVQPESQPGTEAESIREIINQLDGTGVMDNDVDFFIFVDSQGSVQGKMRMSVSSAGLGTLKTLWVIPDLRDSGRGIGTTLLDAFFRSLRERNIKQAYIPSLAESTGFYKRYLGQRNVTARDYKIDRRTLVQDGFAFWIPGPAIEKITVSAARMDGGFLESVRGDAPGRELAPVGINDPGAMSAVARAVREGHAVVLDLSGSPHRNNQDYFLLKQKIQNLVSAAFSNDRQNRAAVSTLYEGLKNAIMHGNKLDLDLPVVFYVETREGKTGVIEIYDNAVERPADAVEIRYAQNGGLSGSGRGLDIMQQRYDREVLPLKHGKKIRLTLKKDPKGMFSAIQKWEPAKGNNYPDWKKDGGIDFRQWPAVAAGLLESVRQDAPGRAMARVDLNDEEYRLQVSQAAREGKLIALDLSNCPRNTEEDYRHLKTKLARVGASACTDDPIGSEMAFALYEGLKNAFVHGNKLDFGLPLVFFVDTDGPKMVIGVDVYDANAKHDMNRDEQRKASGASLFGAGRGLSIIQEKHGYDVFALAYGKKVCISDKRYSARRIARLLRGGTSGSADGGIAAPEPGGIDFRSLPASIAGVDCKTLFGNLPAGAARMNIDAEWTKLQSMVNRGILPSCQRVREYAGACYNKGILPGRSRELLSCVAAVLRMEEARDMPTEPVFKDLLAVLDAA